MCLLVTGWLSVSPAEQCIILEGISEISSHDACTYSTWRSHRCYVALYIGNEVEVAQVDGGGSCKLFDKRNNRCGKCYVTGCCMEEITSGCCK